MQLRNRPSTRIVKPLAEKEAESFCIFAHNILTPHGQHLGVSRHHEHQCITLTSYLGYTEVTTVSARLDAASPTPTMHWHWPYTGARIPWIPGSFLDYHCLQ